MPQRKAEELFYQVGRKKQDAELHEAILADGDHASAEDVGRAVMLRLGISPERIDKLIPRKKGADEGQ